LEEIIVKKMMCVLMFVTLVFVFVTGCGSSGESKQPEPSAGPQISPTVKQADLLDHKNRVFQKPIPDWVSLEQGQIEALPQYKDFYAFKFDESGRSLDGVKLWAQQFSAGAAIATTVKTRVQVKFDGAAVGDKNEVGSFFEGAMKRLSDATFSGYREAENYWLQQRHYKQDGSIDREEYTYYSLYTIPRKTLDGLVSKALNDEDTQEKPKTENEKAARERVKTLIEQGF
jgi:hypothetical protein